MFNFTRVRFAAPMMVALALVACDDDDDVVGTPEPATISATAAATADLSTLVTALQAAVWSIANSQLLTLNSPGASTFSCSTTPSLTIIEKR